MYILIRVNFTNSYPIIYSITALPVTIMTFQRFKTIDSKFLLITESFWNLSGMLDVFLFFMTRRNVLTFRDVPVGHIPELHAEDGENREAELDHVGRLPEPTGVWPEHDIEE
jgi:hypothetical protein